MSKSHGDGAPAYKDPASLRNSSYKRGKKSDMFSLGVILWEISSGKVPCGEHIEVANIIVYRLNGSRDLPFPGTPKEYVNLYSECWDEDPNQRPCLTFDVLMSPETPPISARHQSKSSNAKIR
ncbi:2639_t:CDS:2, partial [Paraglomus occultum]